MERMNDEGEEWCSNAQWESEKSKIGMSKSKGDRKRTYRKVTRMHLYTVKILPTQAWSRPKAISEGRVIRGWSSRCGT